MMESRNCLMRALLEDPTDEVSRLALSDWFEENGLPDAAKRMRERQPTLHELKVMRYLTDPTSTTLWGKYEIAEMSDERLRAVVEFVRRKTASASSKFIAEDKLAGFVRVDDKDAVLQYQIPSYPSYKALLEEIAKR